MHIVIAAYAKFPNKDAESIRLMSFAKLFMSLGHEVYVIGMGDDNNEKEMIFEGVKYISLRKTHKNKIDRIFYYLNYTGRLKRRLKFIDAIKKLMLYFLLIYPYPRFIC